MLPPRGCNLTYSKAPNLHSFRTDSYENAQTWIDNVSKRIKYARSCNEIDINIETNQVFKDPEPYISKEVFKRVKKGISGLSEEIQQDFIQTDLIAFKNELLKCKFAHEKDGKHPELLMYGQQPNKNYDVVIRIDLVCIDGFEHNQKLNKMIPCKLNKVRLQCKTWGDLKNLIAMIMNIN